MIVVTTPAVETDAPAPIREAILKLTAFLLEFKELTVSDEQVKALPYGVDELLMPYREWNF